MFTRYIKKFSRLPYHATIVKTNVSTKAESTDQLLLNHSTFQQNDFRTNEKSTVCHSNIHLGKFYTIPLEDEKQLFAGGGLPKLFQEQTKTFAETCLMVREPAIKLIDNIRHMDFNKPVIRYVLYGENGVGKSLTMAHVLHYGYQNDFLLVHVPWVANWMKRPKEKANVFSNEGHYDLPIDAAAWLMHFKTQNSNLLTKLDLKTSKEYVWSKREITSVGTPFRELVEHGITRIKFATETIAAIIEELKFHATAKRCKVLVAIDGFNAFFHPITGIFVENKQRLTPNLITLTHPFLNICNYDWTNGVCILTLDKIAMTEGYMDSYFPFYLLGKTGFEHLDPFVPVRVNNYSEKEFHSCINYYLDRNWIIKTSEGFDEQLKYMSNKNPFTLMQYTRPL